MSTWPTFAGLRCWASCRPASRPPRPSPSSTWRFCAGAHPPRRALLVAVVYAFATSTWAVSSQGLWQTAWSQPLLVVTLYFLLAARPARAATTWPLILAGGALALSVACRPPNILFAAFLCLYVLLAHRARGWVFFILPLLIGAWLVAYHFSAYGTLAGGYAEEMRHVEHSASAGFTFTYPRPAVLLGLLVSPSRGLFTHSPVLLFCFAALGVALIRRKDLLLTHLALATLAMLIFYSTWSVWWAGNSFSYRFLVDLLPGLCLLLPLVLDTVLARPALKMTFIAALALSIFIQIIGAFFWSPGVWYGRLKDGTPMSVQTAQWRLWDWRDPEALRCLASGPQRPPVFPSGKPKSAQGTPRP